MLHAGRKSGGAVGFPPNVEVSYHPSPKCVGFVELPPHTFNGFSVTASFASRVDNFTFSAMNIYIPRISVNKLAFLLSLSSLSQTLDGARVFLRDINLTREPGDHSNSNFNLVEATMFNNFIHSLSLLEIPLLDCQFT